jgi:hypothetical protein
VGSAVGFSTAPSAHRAAASRRAAPTASIAVFGATGGVGSEVAFQASARRRAAPPPIRVAAPAQSVLESARGGVTRERGASSREMRQTRVGVRARAGATAAREWGTRDSPRASPRVVARPRLCSASARAGGACRWRRAGRRALIVFPPHPSAIAHPRVSGSTRVFAIFARLCFGCMKCHFS